MSAASPRSRRVGAGELAVVGILAVVAVAGGTTGRLFVAGLVVLGLLSRLQAPGDPAACRSRPNLLGSAVAGVGLAALVLGRVDLTALVLVAFAVDLIVGRWRLAQVRIGASTARHAVAGETIGVDLRVRGVRGPVSLTLLDPASRPIRVGRDSAGTVPHLAEHRGIYHLVRLEVRSCGWLATVVTSRIDTVLLDAPIAVHPRPRPVGVDLEPDPAEDGPGGASSGHGRDASEVRALRPYRPGDPRRRVHWPTTARRGELAVVEVDGEMRPWVDLVVELPGLPCDLRHGGSHQEHLDLVTGQARYTAERLLAAGVPVVLTTVESHPDGQPRAVTAAVRSNAELGHRLAAAREARTAGVEHLPLPDLLGGRLGRPGVGSDAAPLRIGPDAGPARRVTAIPELTAQEPTSEHVQVEIEPAADPHRDGPEPWRCSGLEPLDPRGGVDAAGQEVAAPVWVGTLAGAFTALVLADARLPGQVLAVLTVVAVAVGMLRWRRLASPRHAVSAALFAIVAAVAAGGMAGRGVLFVAVATAWALPRLVATDVLERSEEPSGPDGRPGGDPWRMTVGLCAAAVVLMGTTASTSRWQVGASAASIACAVALVGIRRRWWPHVVVSLAVAGMLATASVLVPVWAAIATVAALAGTLVVRADADDALPDLEGGAPVFRPMRLFGRIVVIGALVVLLVPVLVWGAEQVADSFGSDGSTVRDGGSEGWLDGSDRLDLTAPRADRDRVVLLVEAGLPTLLRDSSFDGWDGRTWSSGPPEFDRVMDGGTDAVGVRAERVSGSVNAATDVDGVVNRQHITIRAAGALVLPAAAEPVEVSADAPVVALADGNLRAPSGLRRGDTYLVTSHMPSPTGEELRAASGLPVPAAVQDRYTTLPGLSARASADIRAVAGDLPTVYDQVRALEAWLGDQVEYSLDAPLPPAGADVVDHFLYDARTGWCQQVATTLTLALRDLGVPARLVTGYVASEWDGRRFVVRERHAHAWVEVYFPGIGWYGFDPTSVVPLAADAEPPPRADMEPRLLAGAAILAVALAGWALWRRLRRSGKDVSSGDRRQDPRPWATAADRRIQALGERCGIQRVPGEGVEGQAGRLAELLDDERLRHVARVIQRDAYDREGATPGQRHAAEQVLDAAAIAATGLSSAVAAAPDGPPPPPDAVGRAAGPPPPPGRR